MSEVLGAGYAPPEPERLASAPSTVPTLLVLYYGALFLTGMLMADLSEGVVAGLGSAKLVAIDCFHLAAFATGVYVLSTGRLRRLSGAGRVYVAFLGWLVVELLLGAQRFRGSAFGEFRYVAALFWFFVPLALDSLRATDHHVEGATLAKLTLWMAAAGGVVMLLIELNAGGRVFFTAQNRATFGGYTDFRGVRYLDTYQTYNILLAAGAIMLRRVRGKLPARDLVIAGLLCLAALWTRNRTPVVALAATLLFLGAVEGRVGMILGLAAAAAAAVAVIAYLAPTVRDQMVTVFGQVLTPTEDETGKWRLVLQIAGIQQGLRTPWLGQGYGGYYYFEVPGGEPILAPPHNQYIELFMKSGAIGLALGIAALIAYGLAFWRARKAALLHPEEKVVMSMLLLLVISQVPYGMAYDFPPIFGILIGCGEVILQRLRARGAELEAHAATSMLVASEPIPAPS